LLQIYRFIAIITLTLSTKEQTLKCFSPVIKICGQAGYIATRVQAAAKN